MDNPFTNFSSNDKQKKDLTNLYENKKKKYKVDTFIVLHNRVLVLGLD